jgi:hypothetical protein
MGNRREGKSVKECARTGKRKRKEKGMDEVFCFTVIVSGFPV